MTIDWTAVGSLAAVGILVYTALRSLRADMKERFDAIDKRFDAILLEIKEIRKDISLLSERLSKLEVRVEERTLKVVHVQKTYENSSHEVKEN